MEIIKYQLGIIEDNKSASQYMMFNIKDKSVFKFALKILQRFVDGKNVMLGLGNKAMSFFPNIEQYRKKSFNCDLIKDNDGYDVVLLVRSDDQGEIFHHCLSIANAVKDMLTLEHVVNCFTYNNKYDLSGFEDGIENPQDAEKESVAVINDTSLEGSSFWVIQQWQHDFAWLNNNSQREKEDIMGRSLDNSEQLEDLKDSAHINRTAKENFSPEADMLRKSMPWSDSELNGGLMFSCFSTSFRSFNVQMSRMLGLDDGIQDGIFKFSKILNTNYLWCPSFKKGRLDISLFVE